MKFLQGDELNSEIGKIFSNAKKEITIISPYIKMSHRYESILREKKENPKIEIKVVYGKNEADLSKSMGIDDFRFFSDFPNIEVKHEERLHAKFYSNENYCILTSMNLYSYSQENNIEAGMLFENSTILSNVANNIIRDGNSGEYEMVKYFKKVIENSEKLYETEPIFEKEFFMNKYVGYNVVFDKYGINQQYNNNKQKERKQQDQQASSRNKFKIPDFEIGYCIRSGVEIPFDVNNPMCKTAYAKWNQFRNKDFPEKFCHFSGEPSNGETTLNKPIMRKNWKKAHLN